MAVTFCLKKVARKSAKVASSGTDVSSVVNAREAARSTPRSARKPWYVSLATATAVSMTARGPRRGGCNARDRPSAEGEGAGVGGLAMTGKGI